MSLPATIGAAHDFVPACFPNEIMENIVSQVVDSATLAAMMRVSRVTLAMAAPRLYCEVAVSSENAHSLYLGLQTSDEDMERSGRSVKEVEGSLTRPCSRVGDCTVEGDVVLAGQSHSLQSMAKPTM
jgi:hypothetical protein